MEKQEQIRLVRELMQRLDDGTNVDAGVVLRNPSSAYTCPDLAAREWQTFFRTHPQVIGLSGDLPEPGGATFRRECSRRRSGSARRRKMRTVTLLSMAGLLLFAVGCQSMAKEQRRFEVVADVFGSELDRYRCEPHQGRHGRHRCGRWCRVDLDP